MYLKSLELQGFKSFPDKVTLEFGKGMTAVVGPNGSGKSNIGDAVRWVLGEQSSKTLRGSKMEDVIFGGTELRKPVSFAGVTLNIVDDDHTLKTDADFVSVTRKLYRNGDSEYIVNGNQVRLKDVIELFMDTGLGKDGYSIIGQGRVADIVGSKSNERREIFEEAAGISKFRYKKAEAERRLASAEDNILRLKDILSELEARVEPLRVQSEKAKKYLVLAETRKSLEISVWNGKLSELSDKLGELDDRLLVAQGEYQHLENEIFDMDEQTEQLALKRRQCSVAVEEYREKISELEKQNAQSDALVAVCENNILHYNETLNDLKLKKQEMMSAGEELEKSIADKKTAISVLEQKHSATLAEVDVLEKDILKLSDAASDFSDELTAKTNELNKLYIRKSEIRFSLANEQAAKIDAENALRDAKPSLDEANSLLADAENELKEISDAVLSVQNSVDEHSNRLGGLSMLYAKKTEQFKNLSKQTADMDLDIRNLEQKRKMLVDLENNMEGFAGSVKQIVRAGKSGQLRGIKGTVAQLLSTPPKYSVAIETALGAAMQNVVVDTEDTAKRGIRLLKESGAGRATFLPLTSVKGTKLNEPNLDMQEGFVDLACDLVEYDGEYEGIVRSLLGRIAVAENIDLAANIAKKFGYKFRVITLDGQVVNAGGSFTGGSVSKSAGVLSRRNEINRLDSEIAKAKNEYDLVKTKLNSLSAEVEKLGYDVEGEKDVISELENDKVRFNAESRRIQAAVDSYNERISQIEKLVSASQLKISQLSESSADNQKQLVECENRIILLEADISAAKLKGDEFSMSRQTLADSLSDKKLSLVEIAKDVESAFAYLASLENSVTNSKSEIAQCDEKAAQIDQMIANEKLRIDELRKAATESKMSAERIAVMIKDAMSQSLDYERRENALRASQKSKIERKESAFAEVGRLTERLDNAKRDRDAIVSQLWESYNITAAEAAQIAEPLEDMQDATKRLNEIKNKIRALGAVNTDAVDEYKEVSERYEFMSAQLSDVLKSKEELEKLIAGLTKSMKEIFTDSFDKINENFKKIFVELFGGGKAELKLADPDNVLESGIDINVAPPGKVIKNLSLLSGGEQAFVAIAIYFAILKLRPSPFCILDEIEAALDDVNVTRYAQYLRNFTDTTQFICITHRRGTMEEADVLYGVTMQEKGISKLLRLDLNDISLAEQN